MSKLSSLLTIHQLQPQSHSLHWLHNECDGVSNHRRLDCLPNNQLRRRSKKTSKRRVIDVHKGPVTRKMFPFDDVIIFTEDVGMLADSIAVVYNTNIIYDAYAKDRKVGQWRVCHYWKSIIFLESVIPSASRNDRGYMYVQHTPTQDNPTRCTAFMLPSFKWRQPSSHMSTEFSPPPLKWRQLSPYMKTEFMLPSFKWRQLSSHMSTEFMPPPPPPPLNEGSLRHIWALNLYCPP